MQLVVRIILKNRDMMTVTDLKNFVTPSCAYGGSHRILESWDRVKNRGAFCREQSIKFIRSRSFTIPPDMDSSFANSFHEECAKRGFVQNYDLITIRECS